MQYEVPFTLTERQRKDTLTIIETLSVVIDKVKEIIKENRLDYKGIIDYLSIMNMEQGLCAYASANWLELNDDMCYYFKRRVIPYNAYWSLPPNCVKNSFLQKYDANNIDAFKLMAINEAILQTLITRFNNLNEALILSK